MMAGGRRRNAMTDPGTNATAPDPDSIDDPTAAALFPGRNPHPVMRVATGRLVYANAASAELAETLGLVVGEPIPAAWAARLAEAAATDPPTPIEVGVGVRTYSLLAVSLRDRGFLNVYGTDITAEKVVERFPDRNPNPVLRMTDDGRLLYANAASRPIVAALGLTVGRPLPDDLRRRIAAACEDDTEAIEVAGEGRTYILRPVNVPEFGFTNVYGTDVTATRALNRFPDENPNPVLRVDRDGHLEYANPASDLVRRGLGIAVGERLPDELHDRLRRLVSGGRSGVFEVEEDGRTYELRVVELFEFGSLNLYGTDVTAARAIERANRENERLLLNILPALIAARLREGEGVIADRFDELSVLFADVVDFTSWASAAEPTAVVGVLNEIFSLFDRLADRHGLEKIKTIGDAYMVAGGIDPDRPGDVARVAAMAVEMLDAIAAWRAARGLDLHIRIGLHSGPAVAGVIGLRKFSYDVWGDTVNLASRLEASGVPDGIQVTADTAARLRETFSFERRGVVELKGKGPIETWLLVGRA
jgi:class 3 adenylate cyclase